jgi:hypothetical protein
MSVEFIDPEDFPQTSGIFFVVHERKTGKAGHIYEPDVIYVGPEFKEYAYSPEIPPSERSGLFQAVHPAHIPNLLAHESLHRALYKTGGRAASRAIDERALFGKASELSPSGLLNLAIVQQRMEHAKLYGHSERERRTLALLRQFERLSR